MNQINIGKFIAKCRKEKGYTQEELASKLNVTSKTISRWETGITMPDLSLLQTLSSILEISVSELLNGRKMNKKELIELKDTIDNLLSFGLKENINKIKCILHITKISIIILSIIASLTCLICNIAINRDLSWSLIVISSLILGDFIILPLLTQKKNKIKRFIIHISISILPYLLLLSIILNKKIIFTLGSLISIFSLITLWLIYYLFKRYFYKRKYLFMCITLILLTILKSTIHLLTFIFIKNIDLFNKWNIIETLIILLISLIFLILDYKIILKE